MKTSGHLRCVAVAVALGCFGLQACSNSILRNAAEAGIETVLEGPLPTPTPATFLTR